MIYIYESHLGGLYATNYARSYDELYCEQCGDSDEFLGYAETREEAWELLKPITDIEGSGGYDYDYVMEFLDNIFRVVI